MLTKATKGRGLTSPVCPCGQPGVKIHCNTWVCESCIRREAAVGDDIHEGVVGAMRNHNLMVERLMHAVGRRYQRALKEASREALIEARDRTGEWEDMLRRHQSLCYAVKRFDMNGTGARN